MTEDPYRWLEAIANRREYIRNQLKGGTPVLAASTQLGILLLAVGSGQTKVFEIFDRQALGGVGHPADLDKIRQAIIDAAHLEAFTRAPEDVTLRRLVAQGLSQQLKAAFEQIFAPPMLVRLLLAEVGASPAQDVLVKLGFEGGFTLSSDGVAVVSAYTEQETPSEVRLRTRFENEPGLSNDLPAAAQCLAQEWAAIVAEAALPDSATPARGRTFEVALLQRHAPSLARYQPLNPDDLGLAPIP